MLRRVSGLFFLLLVLAWSAFASGKAYFLALRGEGSASVIMDQATKTAYITDGGKGETSGIQGADIEGERVLDYLLRHRIERLVITCSHPHADHMGGLRAAVRSSKIRKFKELVFIDNDYERRERNGGPNNDAKRKSLKTIYTEKWGEEGGTSVDYISAWNRNAFEGLARQGAEVVASNFVYNPKTIGKDIHDESVVTQYEISNGATSTRMVDFDDASTALIETWNGGRLNVLVLAHHGSANNDSKTILSRREELGLREIIIPVNLNNQYNHPDPEMLRDLLEKFQPEHVFITGSAKGDNIEVTAEGVQVSGGAERNRERLASFLHKRLDRLQAEAESVIQILAGRANEPIAEGLPDGALSEPTLEFLAARKLITPEERTLLSRVIRSVPALEASLKIVAPDDERHDVLVGLGQGLDPLRLDRFPNDFEPQPPESGADRYKNVLASIEKPDEPPAGPGPHPPNSPTDGNGLGSGAAPSMFEEEMTREKLTWGGVMLGNKSRYEGPRPVSLEILAPPSEIGTPPPVIRVYFDSGEAADYADITSTELWAAYNFIQPSAELKEKYGPIPGNAAGLVGAKPREGGMNFSIHPAIIGTHLAREAMRLDMVLRTAAGQKGVAIPATLLDQNWSSFDSHGYQWFDEESRIQVRDGRIEIEPGTEPKNCLLRFRVEPAEASLQQDAFLKAICSSFDAYRTVVRFARVVAVLNWYTRASGKDLPDLPSFVKPVTETVPASWPFVAVFANRPSNQVIAKEEETNTSAGEEEETPTEPTTPPPSSNAGGINWTVLGVIFGLTVISVWIWIRRRS